MSASIPTNLLKREADNLYRNGEYGAAAEKYTDAILQDKGNPELYIDRAMCYNALRKYDQSVDDAKRALKIDPQNSRGWSYLGTAQEALNSHPESIRAYQAALASFKDHNHLSPAERQLKSQCETALKQVMSKLRDMRTMSLTPLTALAQAYDIPVPTIETTAQLESFRTAFLSHPKVAASPRPPMHMLLIPQSPNEPISKVQLVHGPHVHHDIAKILGCDLADSVLLHSEDQVAHAHGNPYGVGLGQLYTLYSAWMDANTLSQPVSLPLNKRASALLCRPGTHGSILVSKSTMIKSHLGMPDDIVDEEEDILCWDPLTEKELMSDQFKRLRAEWIGIVREHESPMGI
ncbi:hypothetical protein BDQ12DRAFT_689374, partial [Crucibulum laeve]